MGLPNRATDNMAAGFLRASKGERKRESVYECKQEGSRSLVYSKITEWHPPCLLWSIPESKSLGAVHTAGKGVKQMCEHKEAEM